MTVLLRELKANRRGLIIWTLALALAVYWIMSLFPSFAVDGSAMEELLELLPEGFLSAFGLDRLSLTDIFGFYATEGFLFVTLFGSMYAVMLGSGILSKEEDEKTIEFLLAKPVTRMQIISEKTASYILYITAFNLLLILTAYFAFEQYQTEGYSLHLLLLLHVGAYLVHLTFAGIGFLAGLFIIRKKALYPATIGLVLGMYFINILSSLSDSLKFLAYLTPFKYVDAVDIIMDEQIKTVYLVILLAVNVVVLATAFLFYRRKDITV